MRRPVSVQEAYLGNEQDSADSMESRIRAFSRSFVQTPA